MFESGIIDFDIIIYFNDDTNFSINSSALVSIGDIVSQITDDDPISKSNNFEIEIMARLLPEPARFTTQNIKYINCLGKWRCEGVTFKDDKCIFTCSGFLQNAKNVEYTPTLPRDGYTFLKDSLNALWGQDNIFNADSLAILNTTCGQKLCEPQKIWEYRFESNKKYTFNNETFPNEFKTLDIKFSTPEDFFNKTLWDFDSVNEDYAEFSWGYQSIFQACGNSILYGDTRSFYNGQLNVYTKIGSSYYLLFPCTWYMFCDSQKPYICQWDKDVFDTVSNYYLNAGTITQTQIDNAIADNKVIENISLSTSDATYSGITYHFKADLNTGFDVWPVTNSATNIGTYTTIGKWYSVDNMEYSIDHVKEALKLLSLSVNENANGVQILQKQSIFENNPILTFDCNNINNLQVTNQFYNVYDGGKITLKYFSAKDGEQQEFDFYTNCAWPETYSTDLLNFSISPQSYTTKQNNTTYVMQTNNNRYMRLGACSGFDLDIGFDPYGSAEYIQWYWPRNTYLTDCENNIYTLKGAYTEEIHYDQDHDIDGYFTQRAYMCFNKNQKIADYRTSKTIEYDFDKMPVPASCKKDLVDVTKVKDAVPIYDVGAHLIYQMETNLDAIDICAGQRAILQNIKDFGDENAVYDILVINRQIHLLNGSCTVQFVMLDSNFIGKIGINEKSHWQKSIQNSITNYVLQDNEQPVMVNITPKTAKILMLYKNLQTGEIIEKDVPLYWNGNLYKQQLDISGLLEKIYSNFNADNRFYLEYNIMTNKSTVNFQTFDNSALELQQKIIALKWYESGAVQWRAIDFPAGLWTHTTAYQYTNYNYDNFDVISDLPVYSTLSLCFMDSAGNIAEFAGNRYNGTGSSKYYYFNLPAEGVFTEFRFLVSPSYSDTQLRFTIASSYRAGFPGNSVFASAYFNTDYSLKAGCKVFVARKMYP